MSSFQSLMIAKLTLLLQYPFLQPEYLKHRDDHYTKKSRVSVAAEHPCHIPSRTPPCGLFLRQ